MTERLRSWLRALIPLSFPVVCTLGQSGCSCDDDAAIAPPLALVACEIQGKPCPAAPPLDSKTKTPATGTIPGVFSLLGGAEAGYQMKLEPVPGRNHFEPDIALVYSSSGGESPVGVGFS